MNIFLFYLWTAPSKALKVGKIQYCFSTGNSSWKLNNSSWKFNNSPSNIRCAKNYSFLFSGDKTFADWQGRNYLIDGCKRWVGIRMRGKKVIWPVIYLCFFRFSRNEIKQLYRLFKTECPSGCLTEEKFHAIFTSFFPWGEDPYQSKGQMVLLSWQAQLRLQGAEIESTV